LFSFALDKLSDFSDLSHLSEFAQNAAKVFIYSIIKAIGDSYEEEVGKYAFEYEVEFKIPVGAGLGSSASFNSVFSGATYVMVKRLVKGEEPIE
jgi:mevalonate kinase